MSKYLNTDEDFLKWVDKYNLCSPNGGFWLTPELFKELVSKLHHTSNILIWLNRNNAFTNPAYGINIGSFKWQPYKRLLSGVKENV